MGEVDVLGSINEYCENKQFKTIIIANEEKIKVLKDGTPEQEGQGKQKTSTKISYEEIKEKIITRTIKCTPNYKKIITEILKNFKTKNSTYKEFLLEHKSDIINVFTAGESGNIRSLKCAIQDFQRLYSILMKYGLNNDLEKYLCAFIAFVMCLKEGKIEKSADYGYIFSDSEVEKIYPLYYRNGYMFNSVKMWVLEGEWNESEVKLEIDRVIKSKKKPEPEEIVRSRPLISLDESIIEAGFQKVIEAAYVGKLTIDEYILLIQNIAWARQISFILPVKIDMNSIKSGVTVCLHSKEESDEPDTQVRIMISTEDEKSLNNDEAEIYKTINQFRDNNMQMFAMNRRVYLSALSKEDMTDLYQCENKRFNLFDNEMAYAVTKFYEHLSNSERQAFNSLFRKMWECRYSSRDLKKAESIPGFEELRKKLTESKERELKIKYQLKAALSESLIQIVDATIRNIRASAQISR